MILRKLVCQASILFFFGKVSRNQKTKYDQYVVTSEEILNIFSKRSDDTTTDMLLNMKIGMFIFILTYFNFAILFIL
jgi:hypothetical protein